MVSRATPAIVLGPTGNLQGTYKFFNLETGLKIKRRSFTRYPMPDSVIKKVEQYAKRRNPGDGDFNFADRSGILFEWNDRIDETRETLFEEEVVPYPTLVAELPGITLHRDIPVMPVEDEIPPQGRAEDAAAANAGFAPLDRRALFDEAAAVIDADAFEFDPVRDDDGNDGIIAVADIPPHHLADDVLLVDADDDAGPVVGDAYHNNNDADADSDDDASDGANDSDDDDDSDGDEDPPDEDAMARAAGLRCSGRATKGSTTRYSDYGLLMHARRAARGAPVVPSCAMMLSCSPPQPSVMHPLSLLQIGTNMLLGLSSSSIPSGRALRSSRNAVSLV
jgi:hypothetical protein